MRFVNFQLFMGNAFINGRISMAGAVIVLAAISTWFGCATRKSALDDAMTGAAKGDPRAEYFLAIHYAKGEGVPHDDVMAAKYMWQAAEAGYAFAQNDLGVYYLQGRGLPQNPVEAANWFRKAAEQGDSLAEYSLGLLYFQGNGVPADVEQSIHWYSKAAEQNQPDATAALGDIYLFGSGVKVNYNEAFKWYQKGARLNNAVSLNGLGFLYERGLDGIPQNGAKAAKYYREAAERGFVRAYSNLGHLYLDGLLMKEDLVEAYTWFTLGVNEGDGVSRHYLFEIDLKRPLSESQKAEVSRRVRDYEAHRKVNNKQLKPGQTVKS